MMTPNEAEHTPAETKLVDQLVKEVGILQQGNNMLETMHEQLTKETNRNARLTAINAELVGVVELVLESWFVDDTVTQLMKNPNDNTNMKNMIELLRKRGYRQAGSAKYLADVRTKTQSALRRATE